jgi:phosphate transport system protein
LALELGGDLMMLESSTEQNGGGFETLEFQLPQTLALLGPTESQFVPAEFTVEQAELKEKLLVMASQAEAAVNGAVKSLIRRDDDLARRTREDDDLIDRLEVEIDDLGLALLAKKPSPLDLRFVTVTMKISNNLERVGDEATTISISRRVLELSHEPQLQQAAEIPHMAALALRMLKDALDAFVSRDPVKARQVIPRDQGVDELNTRLHRGLAALMGERPSAITRCLNLMVISKSLERIADHATNIAEQVVYLYEGRDIRHLGPADRAGNVPDDPTATPA